MSIEYLNQHKIFHDSPLITFVDLQQEYLADGRAHAISNLEECLENCLKILDFSRKYRLPIVHFRKVQQGAFFNKSSDFVHWVDGFNPMHNEMIFEHSLPSCYSCEGFVRLLNHINNPHIILVGLTGVDTCLSTAIYAYHRKHKLTFIPDSSATPSIGGWNEVNSHNFATEMIKLYSEVLTTEGLLKQLKINNE